MADVVRDLSEKRVIESYDPATLEKIGEVGAWSSDDIARAIDRARAAQEQWAATPAKERGRILLRARDYLVDHGDRIAELISRENGKPISESAAAEVFPIIYAIDYYAKNAHRILKDTKINLRWWRLIGRRSTIQHAPRGVVAVISPWNFPFTIPAGEVAMALCAGNAVLLKPARATCLIGEAIGEVFNSAGLPDGLMQVVHGSGSALMQQKLDFIAFTGSVAVGKKIMAQAAENLTPVMLELGGKDPSIVLPDANLDVVSSAITWGAFTNAGQACGSIERLYVHESIADDLTQRIVAKVSKLRQGHGVKFDVDIGPLTVEEQLLATEAHVEDARQRGAEILLGGERNPEAGPGYFYKPTVMRNVQQDWPCVQEETFGPTLPIMTYTDEEEAIRLANDSTFGLTASVWTRNVRKGEAIARRLVTGTAYVNEILTSHAMAETPWGGPKDSGVGRTHGALGLVEFTEPRHVHVNRITFMKFPWMFPYSEAGYQVFKNTNLLLRSGFRPKIRGAIDSLPALRKTLKSLR